MVALVKTWPAVPDQPPADTGPDLERPSRRDALPEHTHYVDHGCEVHESCLTCPLVRCRYDEPGGLKGVLGKDRDSAIVSLRLEGRPIGLIAQRYGVSRRTVFRVLAAHRDGVARFGGSS